MLNIFLISITKLVLQHCFCLNWFSNDIHISIVALVIVNSSEIEIYSRGFFNQMSSFFLSFSYYISHDILYPINHISEVENTCNQILISAIWSMYNF